MPSKYLVSWIPATARRDCRKARRTPGWLLVVALLAFPNCIYHGRDTSPGPRNSVIFCDIEKVFGRHCASDREKAVGIRLGAAAVALNTTGGILRPDFDSPSHPELIDPRRVPEKVHWVDALGVADNGSSLTRTATTSGPPSHPPFNSGAASSEWITHSDGFVEFSAYENTLSHVVGLSKVPEDCGLHGYLCHDNDRSLADIDFGVSLNKDGRVYVIELGALIPGPDLNGSFGTYAANERFRVT